MRCNLVFCDDVRLEATGKHLLIGAYPLGIAVQSAPAAVRVVAWLQVFDIPLGDHSISLTLIPPRGRPVSHASMVGIKAAWLPVAVVLGVFEIVMESFGDIEAFLSIDGQAQGKIGSINVARTPQPSP